MMRQACRGWRESLNAEVQFLQLSPIDGKELRMVINSLSKLRTLSLRANQAQLALPQTPAVIALISSLTELKRLELEESPFLIESLHHWAANNWLSNVTELQLSLIESQLREPPERILRIHFYLDILRPRHAGSLACFIPLHSLTLTYCYLEPMGMQKLAMLPTLRCLQLEGCSGAWQDIEHQEQSALPHVYMLTALQELTELRVLDCNMGPLTRSISALSTLECFEIVGQGVNGDDVMHAVASLTLLTRLRLGNPRDYVSPAPLQALTNLRHLSLWCEGGQPEDGEFIQHLSLLESLQLQNFAALSATAVRSIFTLPRLAGLTLLCGVPPSTDPARNIMQLPFYAAAAQRAALKHQLAPVTHVTFSGSADYQVHYMSRVTSLRSMHLMALKMHSCEIHSLTSLSLLSRLRVEDWSLVDDSPITAQVQLLTQLRELRLDCLSAGELQHLATLTQLTKLVLKTQEVVAAMNLSFLSHLRTVLIRFELRSAAHVECDAVHMLSSLRSLTHINLHGMANSFPGFLLPLSTLTQLQSFTLASCQSPDHFSVDSASVGALARLTALTRLQLLTDGIERANQLTRLVHLRTKKLGRL